MPKVKIGKLLTVLFITVLIWIWADLALEESLSLSRVEVTIGKSTDPAEWVNFVDPNGRLATTFFLDTVTLKGPTSKVRRIRQQFAEGGQDLRLILATQEWATATPGEQTISLLDSLSRNEWIRQHGLTMEACVPETLMVRIDRLVQKSLTVHCVDSNDMTIEAAIAEPDRVDMYVPADWGQVAYVKLTPEEIIKAGTRPVTKKPYVELAGRRREAGQEVAIRTPADLDRLKTYSITTVRAGILISQNLQGRYQVKVDKPEDLYSIIRIRATEQAKQAYEAMRYQVILEIDEGDTKSTGPQEKRLIYNFPERYLRSNEIGPTGPATTIRFTLAPIPTPSGGTPSGA